MNPVREWLGAMPVADFRRTYLRKLPWASPGNGRRWIERFRWEELGQVLGSEPPPDVIVVAKGKPLPVPRPRTLEEMRGLMARGIGVAMRQTERCHPVLREFCDAFVDELGGTPHMQVFVTPGNTHGFGWHYDDEDVFIVQTAGVKDYFFRPNTVMPDVSASDAGGFHRFVDEKSPMGTACLVPGDVLYVPSRWWHMATCRQDALSMSLGLMA